MSPRFYPNCGSEIAQPRIVPRKKEYHRDGTSNDLDCRVGLSPRLQKPGKKVNMIRAENFLTVSSPPFAKAPSGILGLDGVMRGGFPAGRPTLVCGGPGCGKTILAMEFLVRGAQEFDEPGLFLSFEENPAELLDNFRSFGFDVEGLVRKKKLKISHVEIPRGEILESGVFSLDALIVRLAHGIAEIGAKRIALDTIDSVFSALSNTEALRNEIARLFHWLRDKGVTSVITGERGKEELTRDGLQEYVSDCVVLLDHRVTEQTSKRRLRVVKYRGSAHAADEFPFLIGATGFSVLPITAAGLDYGVYSERLSTGVKDIDDMLGGQGYFKGTTVLVTGMSGTGKSSLAANFAQAACQRGERCLYFSFEESTAQIARNMKSVSVDLDPWLNRGLLKVLASRPTFQGLEGHLVSIASEAEAFGPSCVLLDPITNFIAVGNLHEIKSMLTRILDFLKRRGITLMMTALTTGSGMSEETELHVSSIVDTWIALDTTRAGRTHSRSIRVVKSRGMRHSHDSREMIMSDSGITVCPLETEQPNGHKQVR
jgi:circadian clock protein KaiC